MTQGDLECVLDDYRLLNGDIWTMPIVLQGQAEQFSQFQPGQSIQLLDRVGGVTTAVLYLEDKYQIDLENVAERWFGTTDLSHPGVAQFMSRGDVFLGGPIEYLGQGETYPSRYELTPRQTKYLFEMNISIGLPVVPLFIA